MQCGGKNFQCGGSCGESKVRGDNTGISQRSTWGANGKRQFCPKKTCHQKSPLCAQCNTGKRGGIKNVILWCFWVQHTAPLRSFWGAINLLFATGKKTALFPLDPACREKSHHKCPCITAIMISSQDFNMYFWYGVLGTWCIPVLCGRGWSYWWWNEGRKSKAVVWLSVLCWF